MSEVPNPWPYPDLPLRTPHCPVCGDQAWLMVGANLHPMAFCHNEDCLSMAWDPSRSALEALWPALTGETEKRGWRDLQEELANPQPNPEASGGSNA